MIFYSIIYFICSNFYLFKLNAWLCILIGLIINFIPFMKKLETRNLNRIKRGYLLLEIFLFNLVLSLINVILFYIKFGKINWINILFIFLFELIIFWNGIIRVYTSSIQLGVKNRVIGLLLGLIPIAHLVELVKIINITRKECKFENDKILLDKSREKDEICKTKYPILMVHGIFFRDYRYLDYWGRIPGELKKNGATIFYGNHESASPIKESAEELSLRIKEILKETGAKKVNIIAHSKGGLDSRYAIEKLGMDKYVASLTMINTPNNGCEFADYLLEKAPKGFANTVAKTYNAALKKLGDKKPDFLNSVNDLRHSSCEKLNKELKPKKNVYYQCVGSKLINGRGGKFPLNLSNAFVKMFDGPNDGLVGEKSFKYGDNFIFLNPPKKRGISHGDMIDLNRENIDGFDIREFYVKIVEDLKERGF